MPVRGQHGETLKPPQPNVKWGSPSGDTPETAKYPMKGGTENKQTNKQPILYLKERTDHIGFHMKERNSKYCNWETIRKAVSVLLITSLWWKLKRRQWLITLSFTKMNSVVPWSEWKMTRMVRLTLAHHLDYTQCIGLFLIPSWLPRMCVALMKG